jgi:NAD(P)-dependent dehydrogenase (short-subunit alcohol dehydrogenase family)
MQKSVVVTGASGLIGSEIVREFLSLGHKVYGVDQKANAELKHKDYTFFKCDLADEVQVKAAFSKMPRIDVLVNNAAKADPKNKKIHLVSLKEWNKFIGNNLTSVFLCTKYAAMKLKKSQGSIINMSSTRHLMSELDTELYTTAKGGIDGLTKALSISLGPEIRVNSISPGWIHDPKEVLPKPEHEQHPVGRVGEPRDIAQMVIYLSSEAAGFITGQDFVIDGGMTKKMIYRV